MTKISAKGAVGRQLGIRLQVGLGFKTAIGVNDWAGAGGPGSVAGRGGVGSGSTRSPALTTPPENFAGHPQGGPGKSQEPQNK